MFARLLSFVVHLSSILLATEGSASGDRHVSPKDARHAINALVEHPSFLSNTAVAKSLGVRISKENKKTSILGLPALEVQDGFTLGSWHCIVRSREFVYSAKSDDRTELYMIRGRFSRNEDDSWSAQLTEVSKTNLFNLFGPAEYANVRLGMSAKEVRAVFRCPPGAYFAGECYFMYPSGKKYSSFHGSGKEFERACPSLFSSPHNLNGVKSFWQAWISNDIAIWIEIDEKGNVCRKLNTQVVLAQEEDDTLREARELLFGKKKTQK